MLKCLVTEAYRPRATPTFSRRIPMGKNVIKICVRDFESVNFDKICRLALALRDLSFDGLDVGLGNDPVLNFNIDGDEIDRDYRKRGGRSMTESYAIRTGLGVAD